MNKKYGLYVRGLLVKTYDDAIEAHKDAIYCQSVTGMPHEVKEISEPTELDHFKFKFSDKLISKEITDFSQTVFEAKRRDNTDLFDVTNSMYDDAFIYTKTDVDKYIKDADWILI
ncbi:hypothetical protein MOE21_17885 [Bacillus atrophaeus]|uniref:hypothetical protein n=1 Tax=Bacillus atrophaeus TaxID=1452 RepID=UPI002280906A|nr:hypothetical protein [Bacillus atrophaeus]MCY8934453.1 hypothetical protein [Bacillus atrophaeus]